jgi:hypothetical protein
MEPFETINMADVPTKSVAFLWEPFLPIGTVSFLSGEGGLGKSFFTLAVAAAVTRGAPLPGETDAPPPADVIIQNAENPLATVVKPRLEMLGADCTKIHVINENDKRLTLTDERIEAAILRHNAKLTILDPVQHYFGGNISMNRAESVRPALTHLEKVAERTNSVILLVGHLNKARGTAQHRALGSVDMINAVPSALFLGKVAGYDDDIRVVAHGKSNFAELSDSQMFRLSKKNGFEWLGECDATADEVTVSTRSSRSNRVEEAADFLREVLLGGAMLSTDIEELAAANGISDRTLNRAKKVAEVKTVRVDGHWVWSLD